MSADSILSNGLDHDNDRNSGELRRIAT